MVQDKDRDKITSRESSRELIELYEPKIILDNSGENKTVVFEKDDFVPATKQKLGDYLSIITKNAGNSPSINPSSEDISTTTGTGNPKPISDDDSSATSTFTKDTDQIAVSAFKKSSDSDFLKVSKDLNIRIAKGKTDDGTRITVGAFYKDVNTNLGNSKIAKIIEQRQLDDNRFAQSNQYLNPETSLSEEDSNVGISHLQQTLGTHVPRKWPNIPDNNEDVKFKIKNMKNLGVQILLESSGEYYVPEDTDSIGSVILAKAATTAPGLARMGLRVRSNRFSATEIAGQVNKNYQKESKFPELKDSKPLSYGSVNNPLVPFNALNTSNAQVGAILLATTIGLMIKALSLAIDKLGPNSLSNPIAAVAGSLFGKNATNPHKSEQQYRKERLGKSNNRTQASGDDGKNKYSLPGLTVLTLNPYPECVTRGFEVFFDAPDGNVGTQLAGTALGVANAATAGILGALGVVDAPYDKIIDSPGYYNAILRMLIQSATADILGLVGTAVTLTGNANKAESFGVPGALDVNRNIGMDNDPTNLLNSIGQFQNSRVVKFMNVLATLGDLDKRIKNKDGTILESTIDAIEDRPPDLEGTKDIKDKYFPNPAALIKKNKLSDNVGRFSGKLVGKLAWGSNTLRSMYAFPESLSKAHVAYTGLNINFENNPNFLKINNGRITQEDVAVIESELDSCYMPFYFHDIRTNEIISFHAFMETVSDDYDADYTESETYGRMGKVYTYKNTNRSIGFSFKIVATNEDDFNEMWYKINKLVMLVYPQYTAGRAVDTGNGKFIQPFSQLISNSPLIRVRLGDLFKTNYSEFDLARIFGIGTEQFKLNEQKTVPGLRNEENIKKKRETFDRLSKNPPELAIGDRIVVLPAPGMKPESVFDATTTPYSIFGPALEIPFKAEYMGGVRNSFAHLVEIKNPNECPNLPQFLGLPQGSYATCGYSIIMDEDYYNDLYPSEIQSDTTIDINRPIDNFFNPDNNPIVKSFESVAGQGQAGFIRKLTFDFADARWQTEGLNNRAPMWCKVDIGFAPIFDINPGIDSSGAPIGLPYNVGSIMKILKMSKRKSLDEANTTYNIRRHAANTVSTDKEKSNAGTLSGDTTAGFTAG